eukprot:TRINITY_DN11916_c0_g1_i2.p1 TRINITY_DN11916_c0_g1~~TRINITY_DN11916_c0_g1_i2.p1  ORF type:complete len:237 (-),score=53.50 TRINITY_DN11916_c0_g1_i2:213-923(-)
MCIRDRLRALEYPEPEGFSLEYDQMRVLIGWLENQKIREYPPQERTPLCTPASKQAWLPVLHQYLSHLDIADGLPAAQLLEPQYAPVMVRRLLDRAVGFEYGDQADAFNCASAVHASAGTTADSAELARAVQVLAEATGVPMSDGADVSSVLSAVKQVVGQRGAQNRGEVKKFDAQSYPLGFSTGDAGLDRAATALRLVHINHLRELQSNVNDIIRTMQTFTANPKTDSKLGKVGY